MIDQLISLLSIYGDKLLQSKTFETQLVPAALGFVSGLLASWINRKREDKNKKRDELEKEIREINTGITLAVDVARRALGFKRVHALPTLIGLQEHYNSFLQAVEKGIAEQKVVPFQHHGVFSTHTPPKMQIEALERIVLQNINITGRAVSLVLAVSSSANELNCSIEACNSIVCRLHDRKSLEPGELEQIRLGQPNAAGNVNRTYPDLIKTILDCCDNCMHLGELLASDLKDYGNYKVRAMLVKRFGDSDAPDIIDYRLADAKDRELFPPKEAFATWHTNFRPRRSKTSAWKRRLQYISRARTHWRLAIRQFRRHYRTLKSIGRHDHQFGK